VTRSSQPFISGIQKCTPPCYHSYHRPLTVVYGVTAVSQRPQHSLHHVPMALSRVCLNRQNVCGTDKVSTRAVRTICTKQSTPTRNSTWFIWNSIRYQTIKYGIILIIYFIFYKENIITGPHTHWEFTLMYKRLLNWIIKNKFKKNPEQIPMFAHKCHKDELYHWQ